jgi:hypothetical protein
MTLTPNQQQIIKDFKLDVFNTLFIKGSLPLKQQVKFISIVKQSHLQDYYSLHQIVKYFEMEGVI